MRVRSRRCCGALKRLARIEEIAEVIAFAVSPRASYLTGSEILCDGGVVAGTTWRDILRLARRLDAGADVERPGSNPGHQRWPSLTVPDRR